MNHLFSQFIILYNLHVQNLFLFQLKKKYIYIIILLIKSFITSLIGTKMAFLTTTLHFIHYIKTLCNMLQSSLNYTQMWLGDTYLVKL